MNIDVTAVSSDGKTWSEKFADVYPPVVNDGHLIVHVFSVETDRKEVEAAFAPGAWHSWRRID